MFLDSRFQNHPDSVILQKYQSLSNQSFKHNSSHMSSLYLTQCSLLNISSICLSLTVATQKANACSNKIVFRSIFHETLLLRAITSKGIYWENHWLFNISLENCAFKRNHTVAMLENILEVVQSYSVLRYMLWVYLESDWLCFSFKLENKNIYCIK